MTDRLVDLQVSIEGDVSGYLAGLNRQLDFATSVAINNVLNDAQAAIRRHLHDGTFTLRRAEFIDRTVYIGPADRARKDRLEGTVRINPARDFLAKFEEDTVKRPNTSKSLAVPVFRQSTPSVIVTRGDPYNVRRLMQAARTHNNKIRRRRGEPAPAQSARVYFHEGRDGRSYLIEARGSTSRVLYAFESAVPIHPDLRFKDIALAEALARWPERADEAIELAIATAR